MATKRTGLHRKPSPPSAATSSEESSSSEEEEEEEQEEEQEEVRLASPSSPKKNPSGKPSINSYPIPQPYNPSQPPAATASSDDGEEEHSEDEEEDDSGKKVEKGTGEKEEEEDNEGEDEGSSEDEQSSHQPQSQLKKLPQLKFTSMASESSADDSVSDSFDAVPTPTPTTVRPSRTADSSIKPIGSKPMEEPKAIKSSVSSALSQGKVSHKRKRKESDRSELENGGAGQKRQMFQRKWTVDDEIAILQGLAQYRAKNGTLPASGNDMVAFYDFVRGSLQSELSKNQVINKLRHLKNKFTTHVTRSKKGVDSDPHEQKMHELSKKVWGVEKAVPTPKVVDSEGKESDDDIERKMVGNNNSIEMQFDSRAVSKGSSLMITVNGGTAKSQVQYPYMSQLVERIAIEHPCGVALNRSLEMLDYSKAKVLEEKVKQLKLKEIKQTLRMMDLVKETVKVIIDVVGRPE